MFNKDNYVVRKKILAFLGSEVEVFDSEGNLVLFIKQKAFRLKEKLEIFSDRERTDLVFTVEARSILDFGATYDLKDSSGNLLGSFRRNALKSMIKDEWSVLDSQGNIVGLMHEDSLVLALIRRFLLNLIPQNYSLIVNEKEILDLKQDFNPFVYKLNLSFKEIDFDRRLGIVAGVLLSIIEGGQE